MFGIFTGELKARSWWWRVYGKEQIWLVRNNRIFLTRPRYMNTQWQGFTLGLLRNGGSLSFFLAYGHYIFLACQQWTTYPPARINSELFFPCMKEEETSTTINFNQSFALLRFASLCFALLPIQHRPSLWIYSQPASQPVRQN